MCGIQREADFNNQNKNFVTSYILRRVSLEESSIMLEPHDAYTSVAARLIGTPGHGIQGRY